MKLKPPSKQLHQLLPPLPTLPENPNPIRTMAPLTLAHNQMTPVALLPPQDPQPQDAVLTKPQELGQLFKMQEQENPYPTGVGLMLPRH